MRLRTRPCRHCRRPRTNVRGLTACSHCDRRICVSCGKPHGALLGVTLDFRCDHDCAVCEEAEPGREEEVVG